MLREMSHARKEVRPSDFWKCLNKANLDQLGVSGYGNFKRTVALNYFTWVIGPRSSQLHSLIAKNPAGILRSVSSALFSSGPLGIKWKGKASLPILSSLIDFLFTFYSCLLWDYASKKTGFVAASLKEKEEGGAPGIFLDGKLISQDLANSALEFRSITSAMKPAKIKTIIELGAGYGRLAYVFLQMMPSARYVIVDIPPALYISQRYLSAVFPKKKIFKFRKFKRFSEIKSDFESADIAFLLPTQLELLPSQSADLFINISSFQEMRADQIQYYFSEAGRLTKGYFYFKEWKCWHNRIDNITVDEGDYPVRKTWSRIFWRECPVQTEFFEALFKI
jgi:putative sugar O-methyltransferase